MKILPVNNFYTKPISNNKSLNIESNNTPTNNITSVSNPNFMGNNISNRVIDIDIASFKTLSETMKKIYRKKCENFAQLIDFDKMANPRKNFLPLVKDDDMKKFLDCCIKNFLSLKDSPIICLGRSPKWFLNTLYWMKDGIEDYKFVAFSGNWYRESIWGIKKDESKAPTKEEQNSYKNYLKSIQADPASIVKIAQQTGEKVVITDYVRSGFGLKSFLEVMSNIAEEQGVLEDFAKSIRFHLFASNEYLEERYPDGDAPTPALLLPDKLLPYREEIPKYFVDIPLDITLQILENKNTNECRATYYPAKAWGIYLPNKYKTGMIPNSLMEQLKGISPDKNAGINFSIPMRDYRNLLNFRILDYLEQNGLLRNI